MSEKRRAKKNQREVKLSTRLATGSEGLVWAYKQREMLHLCWYMMELMSAYTKASIFLDSFQELFVLQ